MRRWYSGQLQQTVNLSPSGYEGSNPSRRTNTEPIGSERTKEWAAQSAAHAVCVCFAGEFGKFGALARTVLFWRRRFEPKISLTLTFLEKRSVSRAIPFRFCASFIHSFIGSSQLFCLRERL